MISIRSADPTPPPVGPAPHVALVSMPWMAPTMPSIQLATLAAALEHEGIECDRYELYLDYAAEIGLNLYKTFASLLGFTAEWLFARHYYAAEIDDDLTAFLDHRPPFGLESQALEDEVLDVLQPVTERFLSDAEAACNWSRYDVVGFSLTISQVASSMALARLIKIAHPDVTIVFGGAGCAGAMGEALLRACPYVDAVVRVEGEPVLGELARRVARREGLAGVPGTSSRSAGRIVTGPPAGLYRGRASRPPLDFDPFFARLNALGLADRLEPWIPFEGSRGCWYGEKVQCTFCGLHEIMKFRNWDPDDVLAELDHLYARYGIGRFFAVDLIMPKQFFQTLLPQLAARDERWTIFYEIKANANRDQVQLLADAGVRWIQPGIESIDYDLLRLMRKGVWPVHNIQLLKWCAEMGIRVSWNLLSGLPGSTVEMYDRMAAAMPKLHHLEPPSGVGEIQLHRFSPYFDAGEELGIRRRGPHPLYRYVFPMAEADLDDMAYLHDFELVEPLPAGYLDRLRDATIAWKVAHDRGARLDMVPDADGSAVIVDGRAGGTPAETRLEPALATLYAFLDSARRLSDVPTHFADVFPAAAAELGGPGGIAGVVESWRLADLVVVDHGRVVTLAVNADHAQLAADAARAMRAPVGYLEDMNEVATGAI